ncbi:hypothetical protein [Exiguobacterium acetylicum]|uniref:hypothetical protein n=1 Tax=Exiguobacterium acetylicum TaxID=41170 RepID=UPI001EE3037D|nr:hypothetical protein [Exiguobacterium acetylicum]UKS57795.1 hypothetical protein K6T22_17060 [Exiguobacterium acetylicum]
MPDRIGWLSEYELEYLRLYKMYSDEEMTDQQLKELNEIARLLYPPVSKKLDELRLKTNHVMIKAAYNIAMSGGKRAGYILLVNRGLDVEYAKYKYLEHLECIPFYKRERRYREIKAYSLDVLLRNGYEYNHGLKCERLGGKRRYEYVVYG